MLAASRMRSALITRVLEDDLDGLAEIVQLPMESKIARLEKHPGRKPVLYLNTNASPQEVYRVMMDAKKVIQHGPDATELGRRVRQLRAVP